MTSMKRAWTAALLAAMMILSMAGCAPKADTSAKATPIKSAEAAPTQSVALSPTATPALGPLEGLADLAADDVQQIDMYADWQSPETPAAMYSSADDINVLLGWLQSIRTTEALAAPATSAPGDWRNYEVVLFDDSSIRVYFSGDTVSIGDGQQFLYTASEMPDIERQLQLVVDGDSFSVDTEMINYSVSNSTDEEAVVLFVPTLGRATNTGWEKLECTAGFCGVPDPMTGQVVQHELPIKEWYPDAGTGVFRLSLTAYDENNDPYMISDIFEIK